MAWAKRHGAMPPSLPGPWFCQMDRTRARSQSSPKGAAAPRRAHPLSPGRLGVRLGPCSFPSLRAAKSRSLRPARCVAGTVPVLPGHSPPSRSSLQAAAATAVGTTVLIGGQEGPSQGRKSWICSTHGLLALGQGPEGRRSEPREGAAPAWVPGPAECSRGRPLVQRKAHRSKRTVAACHRVLFPAPHRKLWSANG